LIHWATFRTFVASTEEEERVKEALALFVSPKSISSTRVVGHYGNEITILEATLKKREGLKIIQKMRQQLQGEKLDRLRQELPKRVDEDCKLYLRLDKQAAYKGETRLTEANDAIYVCVHIASYPARQDKAMKIVEELL